MVQLFLFYIKMFGEKRPDQNTWNVIPYYSRTVCWFFTIRDTVYSHCLSLRDLKIWGHILHVDTLHDHLVWLSMCTCRRCIEISFCHEVRKSENITIKEWSVSQSSSLRTFSFFLHLVCKISPSGFILEGGE